MTLAELLRTASEMPFNPDDSIDLAGLLIVGLPATISAIGVIVVGVLTIRGQKKGAARAGKIDAKTKEIHEQTVNDHAAKSNMRDDIDETRDLVKEMRELVKDISDRQVSQGHDIRGLRKDIGELRGEDRAAHANHADLVRRLNAFIRREHPDADPL